MKSYKKIITKISKIENMLNEIKQEIEQIHFEEIKMKENKNHNKIVWNSDSVRKDFEELYKDFIKNNSVVVENFVKEKDISYLKEFCKFNNISLDSKNTSKNKITSQIIQWFIQRKAISKRL